MVVVKVNGLSDRDCQGCEHNKVITLSRENESKLGA